MSDVLLEVVSLRRLSSGTFGTQLICGVGRSSGQVAASNHIICPGLFGCRGHVLYFFSSLLMQNVGSHDLEKNRRKPIFLPGRLVKVFFDEHRYDPSKLMQVPWHV
jgi:hypothetical protein